MNCQERSGEELLETLIITLGEALEFNRHAALGAAGEGYTLEKVVPRVPAGPVQPSFGRGHRGGA